MDKVAKTEADKKQENSKNMVGEGVFILFFLAATMVIGLKMTLLIGSSASRNSSSGGRFGWGPSSISIFGESDVPAQFIPIYQAATENYGVPWRLFVSFHRKETTFSTHPTMISSAGVEKQDQFIPYIFVGWDHSSCEGGLEKGDFKKVEKKVQL